MVAEREVQAEDRVIATSQTFKVEAKLVVMVIMMLLVVMMVTMMVLVVSLVAMATSQTFTVAISNA